MYQNFKDYFVNEYLPKGHSFQWNESIIWANVISDVLMALLHFAALALIIIFFNKRQDLKFNWIFLLFFGIFNFISGILHLLNILIIWQEAYALEAIIKIMAAVSSVGSLFLLIPLIPRIIKIPDPDALKALNLELQQEMQEHKQTEQKHQLLISLTVAITTAANIKEAIYFSLKKICEATAWSYGDAWLYNEETDTMEFSGAFNEDNKPQLRAFEENSRSVIFRKGEGLPGAAWERKKPVWESNITKMKHVPRRSAAEAAGIKTALAFPVPLDDKIIAVLAFYMTEVREEDKQLEEIITSVSGQLGLILKQKRLEEYQKETELRFRSLTETSPDAIILSDEKGIIISVNKGTEKIFGYKVEELINQSLTILMPERYREQHTKGIERFLATRQARVIGKTVALEGLKKTGAEFPMELSVGMWQGKNNIFFSGIIRDISERKLAELELIEKNRQLQLSNSELERFAFVASHDMKEPLRMVSNYTQLLSRKYFDLLGDEGKEYINYAVEGVYRLQTLINDLLEYAKVGQADMQPVEVDTTAAIKKVIQNLESLIMENNVQISIGDLPPVQAIPFQVVQLFQNLFTNAIKFRREEPPVITISATTQADFQQFAFSDNGIGINPKYAEKIFVLFQRLHTKEEYPGTGIGLAICKKIIDLHGGKIWVESGQGKGTTFYFTLPRPKKD